SERVLPYAAPCPELARPLSCADPRAEGERRRGLWALCDGLARPAGLRPVFAALPDGVVPYAYAFRTGDLAAARALFAGVGLTVLPWPDLPSSGGPVPEHYRDVALAHFLW
ncbi:MAG: hypothetical protein KGL53_10315, partial [Elusimicrobia bacterium]|nr:hypothetical protein [Elusimicrobiota bacterium]